MNRCCNNKHTATNNRVQKMLPSRINLQFDLLFELIRRIVCIYDEQYLQYLQLQSIF